MRHEARPRASDTGRLAVALAGALGVLLLLELIPELQRPFQPVNVAVAQATAWLLGLMEMPVTRQGTILAHGDGFSYRIGYVCSGIRPAVLIVLAMLMVRASWRQRLIGVGVALLGIEALNFGRLMHLYWVGVHQPEMYFATHRVLWNVIAIAAGIAYLGAWLHLTRRAQDTRDAMPIIRHAHQ